MTAPGSDLEHATRVEGDSGSYHARLSEDWEIWGPNGGYLAAIALRAAGDVVAEIERPASFYCHFLSSPAFDAGRAQSQRPQAGPPRRVVCRRDDPAGQARSCTLLVKTAAEAPGYSHQHPRRSCGSRLPTALKTYRRALRQHSPALQLLGATSSDGPSTRAPDG